MRSTWRLLTLLMLCLLAAGLSGCGASSSPTPAPQRRAAVASPQAAATPAARNAAPGAPPASAPVASLAGPAPAVAAPSLKLPTDAHQVVLVDSTDGEGVWIRRQPAGEPVRVWPEGSPMLIVGEDRFVEGRNWRNVQTLDGQTGWAAADFLSPTDPSALALAASSLNELAGGPRESSPRPPAAQERLATVQSTPSSRTAPPPAAAPPQTIARAASKPLGVANAPSAPEPPSSQQATAPAVAAAARAAATPGPAAMPAPTATPLPTATPVRAPDGARSIAVGQTTLAVASAQRGLPIQIGNRPRPDMELVSVTVKVANREPTPFAHYRSAFRLALSDRTRVEPLAGGDSPLPYSASIEPGSELEGSLTFEVPVGTRVDGLVWAPDRDVTYSLAIPGS